MRQTFKIKFYCRPTKVRKDGTAPVEVSIIVNGEREFFQLPKSCRPEEFPTADLSIYCTAVENKINAIYTARTVADEAVSAYILKDAFLNGSPKTSYTLEQMFDDGLKLKSAEDRTLAAYKKYEAVRDTFYSHTKFTAKNEAAKVTHADILSFKAAIDAIHKPQTVQKEMMRLKYFFLLAFNSGRIRSNPFAAIRIRRAEGDISFLTEDQVEAIRSAQLTEDRLDRVRDAFLFMCGTGLEYADMRVLQPEDVREYGNLHYIKKKRVKTGIEYTTVLQDDAWDIFEFYGGKIPLLSPQKFNKYLKEVANFAKITDSISSLTARHTFGTTLLNRGCSYEVLQKMMGHTTDRETRLYARLLDSSVLRANEALLPSGGTTPPKEMRTSKFGRLSGQSGQNWEDELNYMSEILGI